MGLPADTCDKLEIAGLLHDLGKLQIPDEILESPGALADSEQATIRSHSYETFQILRSIDGLGEIADWAAYHHESLNGNGYPFRLRGRDLTVEARIIRVADIFQAMAQDRPYRGPMSPARILEHLLLLAERGELDTRVVGLVARDLKHCSKLAGNANTRETRSERATSS
jgi:HD-GYP domain-containing protein (c-di-GMP phosphodiesterase class II)